MGISMIRFNTMCKCCRAYENYTKKGINEKIYVIGFHIIIFYYYCRTSKSWNLRLNTLTYSC